MGDKPMQIQYAVIYDYGDGWTVASIWKERKDADDWARLESQRKPNPRIVAELHIPAAQLEPQPQEAV
jgi:hypothetical protein